MGTDTLSQSEPLALTLIPFQNVEATEPHPDPVYARYGVGIGTGKWSKKPSVYGAFTEYAYGSVTTIDTPGVRVIGYPTGLAQEAVQVGVICSPESGLVVIDVDDPEAYADSELGDLLPLELAYTRRGPGGHIYLDMRHIPREKWPTQGPIKGGDIKAAGFVAAAGSLHYSGDRYERTGNPILVVTEEELEALLKAKEESTGPSRPGAYRGNGHGDDDLMARSTYRWVFSGLDEDEVRERWQELADDIQDPSWPFSEKDFQRHYQRSVAKYEAQGPQEGRPLSPETLAQWGREERFVQEIIERTGAGQDPNVRLVLEESSMVDISPLTCDKALKAKAKAQLNDHSWSIRYWKTSPLGSKEAMAFACDLIETAIACEGKQVPLGHPMLKQRDPHGAMVGWMAQRENLIRIVDGYIQILPDRVREVVDEDEEPYWVAGREIDPRDYPESMPYGINPAQGKRHDSKTMARQVAEIDHLLTRRNVALGLPDKSVQTREILDYFGEHMMTEGMDWPSMKTIQRARKKAQDEGLLVVRRRGFAWRDRQAWAYEPPRYYLPEEKPLSPVRRLLEEIRYENPPDTSDLVLDDLKVAA